MRLVNAIPICALLFGCGGAGPTLVKPYDYLFSSDTSALHYRVDGSPDAAAIDCNNSVFFDGEKDRVVIAGNPLAGATEFTIEAIIRPSDAFATSPEPRFLHIENSAYPQRRITLELRLTADSRWYLDTFISSDNDSKTLLDSSRLHPVNRWYSVAITYKDTQFVAYVNGIEELRGQVVYQPIDAQAQTSVGSRMNSKYWYRGHIYALRFNTIALPPDQFLAIPPDCHGHTTFPSQ